MRTLLASLLLLGKLHFYRRDPPLNNCHHFEAHNVRHYCTLDGTVNPFHVRNGNKRRLPWKLRLTAIGIRFNDQFCLRRQELVICEKWSVRNKMWIAIVPNIEFIYPTGAIPRLDVTVAYRRHWGRSSLLQITCSQTESPLKSLFLTDVCFFSQQLYLISP